MVVLPQFKHFIIGSPFTDMYRYRAAIYIRNPVMRRIEDTQFALTKEQEGKVSSLLYSLDLGHKSIELTYI